MNPFQMLTRGAGMLQKQIAAKYVGVKEIVTALSLVFFFHDGTL